MGVRITQMDPLQGALDKHDLFEIARPNGNSGGATYSVTAEQISDFYKLKNNGSFRGYTTKSLDDFSYADNGTWYWQGTPALSGMPSVGILEIIGFEAPSDVATSGGNTEIYERLTSGADCFIRTYMGGMWSSWGILSNKNGNIIFSGVSSDAHVTFPVPFAVAPVVTVTPATNATPNDYLHVINLGTVNSNGFDVVRYKCSLGQYVEAETINTTEQSGTTTTKTYNRQVTGYQWEAGDFSYYWIATLDG